MGAREERYVVERSGNRGSVVFLVEEHEKLIEDPEELESIRAFDLAKASGEKPIPFEEALSEIGRHKK